MPLTPPQHSCVRATRFLTWLLLLGSLVALPASAQWQLGRAIPLSWHEDTTASMGILDFQRMPAAALHHQNHLVSLGYTRSALWVRFVVPASLFATGNLWLQVGPNFLDHITLYYRPQGTGPWTLREAGDLAERPSGDLDYRFPVFVLPAASGAQGLEVVVRVRSTSAVLLDASVWTPEAYLANAASTSAFWGAYFSLAALSTLLAFLAALRLRRRLAWAVCMFSLAYALVACVQGYVGWLPFASAHVTQHYLTSVLTLLVYTCLLWVTTEALNLRVWWPRLYRALLAIVGFGVVLLVSIPLDFYGFAIHIQAVFCVVTALVLAASGWRLWRNQADGVMTLVLGLMPLLYVVSALMALVSLFGFIPYNPLVYGLWQYVVMANMFTVLGWVAYNSQREARELREKHELAWALEREREASFHQRQFIAIVSHEFRTPLAVIANALENLMLPSINDDQRQRRYRNMRRATDRLVQLTDNCLADSRLDAGGLTLQRQPVDVLELIRSCTDAVDRSDAHRWSLLLNGVVCADAVCELPAIFADPAMLRIAVSNLLDNAVKYSGGGNVQITVDTRDTTLVIGIRDHGCGIAPRDAVLVFERYRRGSAGAGTTRPAGAGLGLYVARQIVRAHGGELCLAWSGKEGSCFEMTLPNNGTEHS